MAQVLKDEVEARIRSAALDVFSGRGYAGARMAEIAVRAGVSTGNIYHYFRNKGDLFRAVIPASLVTEFWEMLDRRLEAAGQVPPAPIAPVSDGTPDASYGRSRDEPSGGVSDGLGDSYPVAARATVDFALDHRREMIFLLGRAEGSPHAGLAERVVGRLVAAALDFIGADGSGRADGPVLRFDLEQIYHAYIQAWVRILEAFPDPGEFRAALGAYERYHLAGLRELVE